MRKKSTRHFFTETFCALSRVTKSNYFFGGRRLTKAKKKSRKHRNAPNCFSTFFAFPAYSQPARNDIFILPALKKREEKKEEEEEEEEAFC